jgi:hypothetical protein
MRCPFCHYRRNVSDEELEHLKQATKLGDLDALEDLTELIGPIAWVFTTPFADSLLTQKVVERGKMDPEFISQFSIESLFEAPLEVSLYALMYHHYFAARRLLLSNIIKRYPALINAEDFYLIVRHELLKKLDKLQQRQPEEPCDIIELIHSTKYRKSFFQDEKGRWKLRQNRWLAGSETINLDDINEINLLLRLAKADYTLRPPFSADLPRITSGGVYSAEEEQERRALIKKIYVDLVPLFLQSTVRTPGLVYSGGMAHQRHISVHAREFYFDEEEINPLGFRGVIYTPTIYPGAMTVIENIHLELLRQIYWQIQNLTIFDQAFWSEDRGILREGIDPI